MFALNVDANGRILSATYEEYAAEGQPIVETLPEGNISDYIYSDGKYVYNPLPKPVEPEEEVTTDDVLNAMLGVIV